MAKANIHGSILDLPSNSTAQHSALRATVLATCKTAEGSLTPGMTNPDCGWPRPSIISPNSSSILTSQAFTAGTDAFLPPAEIQPIILKRSFCMSPIFFFADRPLIITFASPRNDISSSIAPCVFMLRSHLETAFPPHRRVLPPSPDLVVMRITLSCISRSR